MKASDITDTDMLRAVLRDQSERGSIWACTWTLAEREGWPTKVAAAKLRKLKQRGLLEGCDCGCRGDWELTPEGARTLLVPVGENDG